ncbi:MAG: PEP-CTERM sorting domain-containing protein [Microcoleaceae cyanobacterium MO_207.B10]|nr:PEP-CTERM sorting domain-containing protein [Microcoleaceae cyanobacterium MO_207.B10]
MTTLNQTAKILGRAIATLAAGATLTVAIVAPAMAFNFTQTIKNVSVDGKNYDVGIYSGTLISFYGDDPNLANLAFNTKAEADAASQALFDLGVFSNTIVAGQFDGSDVIIEKQVAYTPYAYNYYYGVSFSSLNEFGDDASTATFADFTRHGVSNGFNHQLTWAVWEAKPIPEPTTILASITAGGIGFIAKRRQAKTKSKKPSN